MTIDRKLVVGRILRVALCGKKKDSMNTKNNLINQWNQSKEVSRSHRHRCCGFRVPNALQSVLLTQPNKTSAGTLSAKTVSVASSLSYLPSLNRVLN
jgi:hypothetical protein